MQPYINPYLFQSPYFMNMGNNPIPNTQTVQAGLSAKYVNDFGEITASDIPMNGQPAIFAKSDKSEIQLREWSPNGQIITTLYKPYFQPKQEDATNTIPMVEQPLFDAKTEVLDPIFERISALEDKLDKLSKPTTSTKGAAAK